MNELQLFTADGPLSTRGFRTILTGPQHIPYGAFVPAAGHQLGFNELKVIEARHLLECIGGRERPLVDFEKGLRIERTVYAMARSAQSRGWVDVGA